MVYLLKNLEMLLYTLIAQSPIPVTAPTSWDLLQSLWQLSPILALMALVIGWLVWKNEKLQTALYDPEKGIIAIKDSQIKVIAEKKDAEIKEMNEYIRENDKENLEVLSSLNNTMDKLIQTIVTGNDSLKEKLINEATGVKTHVDAKIAELKEKINKG